MKIDMEKMSSLGERCNDWGVEHCSNKYKLFEKKLVIFQH